MTPIPFPTLSRQSPAELQWTLISNTQGFSSPLTASEQTTELPGARWQAVFTMKPLLDSDNAALQAFLVRLRGKAGRVLLYNFARPTPRGIATGTPLVKGGGQFGTQLLTDGWTASKSGILKSGDFIGVNGELKMVVADADSDASGNATLQIEPPLRNVPADNAVITISKPTATFKFESDNAQWSTTPPFVTTFSLTFVETF